MPWGPAGPTVTIVNLSKPINSSIYLIFKNKIIYIHWARECTINPRLFLSHTRTRAMELNLYEYIQSMRNK